jgi:hypothetical protein
VGGGSMSASNDNSIGRFSVRALRLLESVEHRCARTRADKAEACRIRREADQRRGLMEARAVAQSYEEAVDDAPNAWVTTTFIDGALAGTLRIHVSASEQVRLPALDVFSDVVTPYLQTGRTIVEMTRLAARLEYSRGLPEAPYVALRPAWLAAEYFDADFILATVCPEHEPFYRRVFGFERWSEPRETPCDSRKMCLMGLDFRPARDRVLANYPVYRSLQAERDALFRRRSDLRVVASARGGMTRSGEDGRRAGSLAWR